MKWRFHQTRCNPVFQLSQPQSDRRLSSLQTKRNISFSWELLYFSTHFRYDITYSLLYNSLKTLNFSNVIVSIGFSLWRITEYYRFSFQLSGTVCLNGRGYVICWQEYTMNQLVIFFEQKGIRVLSKLNTPMIFVTGRHLYGIVSIQYECTLFRSKEIDEDFQIKYQEVGFVVI